MSPESHSDDLFVIVPRGTEREGQTSQRASRQARGSAGLARNFCGQFPTHQRVLEYANGYFRPFGFTALKRVKMEVVGVSYVPGEIRRLFDHRRAQKVTSLGNEWFLQLASATIVHRSEKRVVLVYQNCIAPPSTGTSQVPFGLR
jgi:hypothetical protein